MEFETKTIVSTQQQQLAVCSLRGLFFTAKIFHFIIVLLSCTFFWLTACWSCSLNGMKSSAEYDACGPYKHIRPSVLRSVFPDVIPGDTTTGYVTGRSPTTPASVHSFCTNSRTFCFHSTMPSFLSKNCKSNAASSEVYGSKIAWPLSLGSTHSSEWASSRSWSTDYGVFAVSNGKTISRSLNSKNDLYALSFAQTDGVHHQIGSAMCMQLLRSSQDKLDAVMVALDVNLNGEAPRDDIEDPLSASLTLLEGSDPVQSIEFYMKLPSPLNISPPDILFHVSEMSHACSQPLAKELFARNTGDRPLDVKSIKVPGTECWLDGFLVHTWKGIFLDPGESVKFLITHRIDFSAVMVLRDLELTLASGYLMIPMKASLPIHTLNLCKKSVFWMRLKKFSLAVLIAVSFMFPVFCCVCPQVMVFSSQDYLYKSEKRSITSKRSDHRNKFSLSIGRDCLFRLVEEYKIMKPTSVCKYRLKEGMAAHHEKPTTLENHRNIFLEAAKDNAFPSPQKYLAPLANSVSVDASQTGNLIIRSRKGKRKRRKIKSVVGNGSIGQIEVSSSQSGNSTPSSPLTPVISVTPMGAHSPTPDVDPTGTKNPFTQVIDQRSEKSQVSEPTAKATVFKQNVSSNCCSNKSFGSTTGNPSSLTETASKRVLLHSATFPGASRDAPIIPCSSPLSSKSEIAPHARAPGSKLYNQKTMKVEEKVRDEYAYDIWGDHLSRLCFMGISKNITTISAGDREEESYSLFVRAPQAFITKPQQKYVLVRIHARCSGNKRRFFAPWRSD